MRKENHSQKREDPTDEAPDSETHRSRITRRRAIGVLGAGLAFGAAGTVQAGGHEADVWKDGDSWYAANNGNTVYGGDAMLDAMQAAVDSLTGGRTAKETVVVWDSGTVGPHEWDGDLKAVDVPSYTVLDVRGTIDVQDTGDELVVPVRAQNAESIEIPRLSVTGNPRYGLWIQSCSTVTLGTIDMDLQAAEDVGLGIRIDDSEGTRSKNVSLEYARVENTPPSAHGVETYSVDGFQAGEVHTRDTGGCGLLLNDTTDATVDLVDAVRADEGGGYAGVRFANGCGPNITVNEVNAVRCGRGIFAVSGSEGIDVFDVHVENCGSGALIQDTRNLLFKRGTIENNQGEGIRIDSRWEDTHHHTRDVTIEGITIEGNEYGVRETGPDTEANAIVNNHFCANGTHLETHADTTEVRGNTYHDGNCGPIDSGTYVLENVNSGKALDVADGSTENGANVQQWDSHGGAMQQWRVQHQGNGEFTFINGNSGKALDITAGGTDDGDTAIQWEPTGGANQRFTIEEQAPDEYMVINVNSGKALDVYQMGTENGDDVVQWEPFGNDNQRWTFTPV